MKDRAAVLAAGDSLTDEEFWTMAGHTVAIDFDGVLHPYTDGWRGSTPVDEEPMPGALAFVKLLLAEGFKPVVFSTRADHTEGLVGICDWMNRHGFPTTAPADPELAKGYRLVSAWGQTMDEPVVIGVTWTKPPAIAYVDDRAVPFAWDPAPPRSETSKSAFIRAMGGVRRLAEGRSGASGPGRSLPVAPAPPGG